MRQFVMGARINLETGNYHKGMAQAIRATENFSNDIRRADGALDRYGNEARQTGTAVSTMARQTQDAARNMNQLQGGANNATAAERRLGSAARESTSQLRSQEQQVTTLKDRLFSLQGVIAAVAGSMAIKGAYNWLVGANADMETYQNTLTVVLGSQEKAIEQLAWAEKFAASTPFEIPQIMEATTRLESYGMESKKVLGITGDMASVMGKDLMQAVEAVADAQTGGLERLKEFGITKGMIEDQAKLLGTSPINKAGQITDFEAFNTALFSLMEKRFKGGMEMQSKTFKGMLSNVADFTGRMGRKLGAPIFESAKKNLRGFLDFLNGLEESGAVDRFVGGMTKGFQFVGKGFGLITEAGKAFYDMIFGSGDLTYFVKLFGAKAAVGFKNVIRDIIDTFKALWSFASDTLFPILKDGFMLAVEGVKEFASFLLESYSTLKEYLPYIQGLALAFGIYYGVVKMVAAATKIWAAMQLAFNAVMAMNPIFLIIIAVGLLIGYLIHLAGGWDVVREKLAVLWTYLVDAWNNIWTTLQPILQSIGQKAVEIWQYLIEVVPPILLSLWQTVVDFFVSIWTAISPLLTTIWTGIVNIFNSIKSFWQQWGGLIMAVFSVYFAGFIAFWKQVLKTLWVIVKGAFTFIKEIISGVFKVISGIIQVAWSVISGLFSTALNLLSGDWSGAWDSMLGMLSGVWSGIKDFFGGLKDLFFDSGAAIMRTLADGIKSMISAPFEAVKGALKKVRDLLPFSDAKEGPLSSLTHNGGKIVTTMAEGVYRQAGTLHRAMSDTLDGTPTGGQMTRTAFNDTLDGTPTGTTVKSNAYRVNAAGNTPAGNGGNRTSIRSLIEKLVIEGADKDGKMLADEIIEALYDKLKQANEILSTADWEGLLHVD